ncbi:MAG: MMPL family transporter [Deltaproteobacteria bacterium]|nr:MMPL family transporter [Deltaproteobacteria bacterium]
MRLNVPRFSRLVANGAAWCIRRPVLTFGITLVLLIGAGLAALKLRVDPSPEAYLEGTEVWNTFRALDRSYGIGETIVIALREPGGTVFDAETVQTVAELDRVITGLSGIKRVLSIASASMLGKIGAEGAADVIDVGRLLPEGSVSNANAAELGNRISRHPVFRRLLIDPRHETTFLFVQLDSDLADPVRRLAIVREIRSQIDRFQSKARTVHLAGTVVTKEAIASGVQHDLVVFFPAAALLLAVLLWIALGELLASLIPLCVVGFSSLLVLGLLGLAGTPLNMATATIPTIILVVGLADSVHYFSELRRQYARTGDRELSLVAAVEAIALPCLLTSTTSAAGFMALMSSRLGPLRQFGYGAALGLLVAYLVSMLLTPTILSALQYPRRKATSGLTIPRLARFLTRVAIFGVRRLGLSIGVIGLLSGACLAALSHLRVNSDFVDYLQHDHRLRHDLAVIEDCFGGADTIEVFITGAPSAFLEPQNLERVDQLGGKLRKMDGLRGVFSFVDYLKLANHALSGKEWTKDPREAGFELPPNREAVSQLLLLDAEGFNSLAAADMGQVRLTIQIPTRSSESVRELTQRVEKITGEVLAGSGLTATVTGLPPMFADVVRNLVEDSASSFALAALAIWLAMVVGLRSLQLATVAMIPNVLPVGLTFASMVALGLDFDANSAFVACLGIGIAVDATIHIVTRYQKAREHGSPTPATALQYTLTHAGQPVIVTSVLLMAGFSVLCLSSFVPTVRVGLLSALLVLYAMLFDLFITPVLLIAVDRVGAQFEPEAKSQPSEISGRFEAAGLTSPPTFDLEDTDEEGGAVEPKDSSGSLRASTVKP